MNQIHKKLLCLAALISGQSTFGAITTVSKIVPRSQSLNMARQIVGWDNADWGIARNHEDERYRSFNAIFEYTRTFRDNRIARCLFGDDLICDSCGDSTLKVSGSAVADRNNATDWLADYFGLPRDYQSTVTFKPEISNFLIDFSYFVGLDEWVKGMYFRIHGPYVHTKWNLNARETCATGGEIGYFDGYFSDRAIAADDLNTSFLAYANGATPTIRRATSGSLDNNTPDDIVWQSLCCSRISDDCECDSATRNGFGELRFMLGKNLVSDPDGDSHLGVALYVAAPTGTRIGGDCEQGRLLFEPIVGNGKHWELGAHMTTHRIWWRNEEEDKSFGVYIEAMASHLFKANQIRCLDLCSAGGNSRYMLAQRLQRNRNTDTQDVPINVGTLNLEFADEYAPVANLTRRQVESTISVQGDIAISFAYQSGDFQWDLGYDFWGRSCEKLKIKDCCCPTIGDWALKGDQRVYGFQGGTNFGLETRAPGGPLKLAATDSRADIHTGSNLCNDVDYTPKLPTDPTNLYADNSKEISATIYPQGVVSGGNTDIHTSFPAILISDCDLDLNGTRGHSHKIFTHFNWAKTDLEDTDYTPYMGFGAEIEFGKTESSCCKPCPTDCNTGSCSTGTPTCKKTNCSIKDCCPNCAISQWGIWFKIGASRY